jgi:hypothetical protein
VINFLGPNPEDWCAILLVGRAVACFAGVTVNSRDIMGTRCCLTRVKPEDTTTVFAPDG